MLEVPSLRILRQHNQAASAIYTEPGTAAQLLAGQRPKGAGGPRGQEAQGGGRPKRAGGPSDIIGKEKQSPSTGETYLRGQLRGSYIRGINYLSSDDIDRVKDRVTYKKRGKKRS